MWGMAKLKVSAMDFALNLIVAMISTSGLLWLGGDSNATDPSMADAAKARLEGARGSLDKLQDEMSRLDEELQRLLLVKRKFEQEKNRSEGLDKEIEELKKKLAEKLCNIGALREEIAKIKRQPIERQLVRIDVTPRFVPDARKPVFILLSQGTVTPVREPYYTFTQSGDVVQASLSRRGDSVDRALANRSDFQKLLGEINLRSQYVFLLVDSSSFETFRAVRAWLEQRKIPFGWEPNNYPDISWSPNGKVQPGISN